MKKYDAIVGVFLLEAAEARELMESGSYYYEDGGRVLHFDAFCRGARELHGTWLVMLGFGELSYACVTREVYGQLTNGGERGE